MIRNLIRIAIFLVIALICGFFVWYFSKNKKKHLITIVVVLIPFGLLLTFPFENSFISFSNPTNAFYYYNTGTIQKIVEGDDSAFIYYQIDNSTYSYTFVLKEGQRWKIAPPMSERYLYQNVIDGKTIQIMNLKETNDFYVSINEPFVSTPSIISDNRNSTFSQTCIKNKSIDNFKVVHYAYINNLSGTYILTINDAPPLTITI